MKAKVQWQLPGEEFLYDSGVIMSQEGSIFHVITDKTHKLGVTREHFVDRSAAISTHAKLVKQARRLSRRGSLRT
jgi:hypothetical protein